MSVIEKFLREAGGNWLRAEDCISGDQLKITTVPVIDDETFKNAYLICGVVLMRTSENKKLRMGPKNVSRITEALGRDENSWVGRLVEVVSIETYPGLGTKGLLLRGLPKEAVQTQMTEPLKPPVQSQQDVSAEAINVIKASKDLIGLDFPLNSSDWNLISAAVRVELVKRGFVQEREKLYYFTQAAKKLLAS